MDDRRKTLAALTVLTGFIVLIIIVIGIIISSQKVLSPVPDDSVIRIIFVSPSPKNTASPSAAVKN